MKKHQKIGLITGGAVFAVNMLENVVYYSLGKKDGNGGIFKMSTPTVKDFSIIIITSALTGLIVGYITKRFVK